MKKHNEGYTLPLVLVVMIIMCLIAVSVMSVALHNLQSQKASIQRMESKYAAQGEIEKAVAELTARLQTVKTSHGTTSEVEDVKIQKPVTDVINALFLAQDETWRPVQFADESGIVWTTDDKGDFSCRVSLCTASNGEVNVSCTILLENVITVVDGTHFYEVPEITYISYEIGGGAV